MEKGPVLPELAVGRWRPVACLVEWFLAFRVCRALSTVLGAPVLVAVAGGLTALGGGLTKVLRRLR